MVSLSGDSKEFRAYSMNLSLCGYGMQNLNAIPPIPDAPLGAGQPASWRWPDLTIYNVSVDMRSADEFKGRQ
jgi:hypothetical protein